MKSILRSVAILLLCGTLAIPMTEAQSRGRGNQRTHQPASAPTGGGSRPGNSGQRPGNGGHNPGNRPGNSGQRPGNGGHNPGNRPGNSGQRPGNNGNRPGNNGYRPGGNRPGYPGYNGPGSGPGPSRPGRPSYGHHPGPPPGPPPGHMRPNMPPPRPFYRPAPPPYGWRPYSGWRPFNSVLGVTFGTAIGITINALINNGYTVSNYGNDVVYVDNVQMLNMWWPDAVLYFNNAGGLYASRFIYSSSGYDMSRYNIAYSNLVASYGAPVNVQNTGNGIETVWWGPGNQFIRLSYSPEYSNGGYLRYFTTLSFGI